MNNERRFDDDHRPDESSQVAALLTQYQAGVKLFFDAWDKFEFRKQRRGGKIVTSALMGLDALDRRSALLSLLESEDPKLSVSAAEALIRLYPERALAVLQKIDSRHLGNASMYAMRVLFRYRLGEFGS